MHITHGSVGLHVVAQHEHRAGRSAIQGQVRAMRATGERCVREAVAEEERRKDLETLRGPTTAKCEHRTWMRRLKAATRLRDSGGSAG